MGSGRRQRRDGAAPASRAMGSAGYTPPGLGRGQPGRRRGDAVHQRRRARSPAWSRAIGFRPRGRVTNGGPTAFRALGGPIVREPVAASGWSASPASPPAVAPAGTHGRGRACGSTVTCGGNGYATEAAQGSLILVLETVSNSLERSGLCAHTHSRLTVRSAAVGRAGSGDRGLRWGSECTANDRTEDSNVYYRPSLRLIIGSRTGPNRGAAACGKPKKKKKKKKKGGEAARGRLTTNEPPAGGGPCDERTGGDLLSQAREGQVPSALWGFVPSVFGMDIVVLPHAKATGNLFETAPPRTLKTTQPANRRVSKKSVKPSTH